ncbi:MAG: epoxyqueuosine reductase, partial [Symbiobacteriaceae bacterium]|nr:epoxyqueuosine reductase [Symbiobacteriaceae bacterium]
ITPAGCAGRFGSVLLSQALAADERPDANKEKEPCAWFREGSCRFCITNCPTGALTEAGIDRHLCNDHLLKISEGFTDLGLCDVCGKCAIGPCAISHSIST